MHAQMLVRETVDNSGKATREELEEQHALSVQYENWSNDLVQMNDRLFEDYRQALKMRKEKEEREEEEEDDEECSDWW